MIFGDIMVQVPPDDYGKTVGLCGTFDNNTENDGLAKNGMNFPFEPFYHRRGHKNFTESWR